MTAKVNRLFQKGFALGTKVKCESCEFPARVASVGGFPVPSCGGTLCSLCCGGAAVNSAWPERS